MGCGRGCGRTLTEGAMSVVGRRASVVKATSEEGYLVLGAGLH